MAKRKISDALRSLNTKYNANLTYQGFWLGVASGRVPAERDTSERFWLIDEDDEPFIARTLGLIPAELDAEASKPAQSPSMPPAAHTAAKSEPAAKPTRPHISSRRSAA
jgi:hypothetical protein